MTTVLVQKLTDLLENIRKWPAECEIAKVFFHMNFPLCSMFQAQVHTLIISDDDVGFHQSFRLAN